MASGVFWFFHTNFPSRLSPAIGISSLRSTRRGKPLNINVDWFSIIYQHTSIVCCELGLFMHWEIQWNLTNFLQYRSEPCSNGNITTTATTTHNSHHQAATAERNDIFFLIFLSIDRTMSFPSFSYLFSRFSAHNLLITPSVCYVICRMAVGLPSNHARLTFSQHPHTQNPPLIILHCSENQATHSSIFERKRRKEKILNNRRQRHRSPTHIFRYMMWLLQNRIIDLISFSPFMFPASRVQSEVRANAGTFWRLESHQGGIDDVDITAEWDS